MSCHSLVSQWRGCSPLRPQQLFDRNVIKCPIQSQWDHRNEYVSNFCLQVTLDAAEDPDWNFKPYFDGPQSLDSSRPANLV